jgi:general secretion pathway protein B
MSYILEALKKAQAERQLGATPTIHAPTLDGGAGVSRGSTMKKPLVIALGVMAAAIVALLALLVRQQAATAPSAPQSAPSQPGSGGQLAPAAAQPQSPSVAAAPSSAQQMPAVPSAVPSTPRAPAPEANVAAPQRTAAPVPPVPRTAVAPATQAPEIPAEHTAVAAQQAPAPAQPEVTQTLRDLPEPIQRAIPQITFGGYMYSKNPADRMVLIDKILRKEGDEVAPGLVLEKLLPKAAIFTFRGYRYRVSL